MMQKRGRILNDIVMLYAIVVAFAFLVPYFSEVAHAYEVGMRVVWVLWLFFLSGGGSV